ncbi:hypothetical protein MTO96_051185 [Rhipicephalus appendiculatus]
MVRSSRYWVCGCGELCPYTTPMKPWSRPARSTASTWSTRRTESPYILRTSSCNSCAWWKWYAPLTWCVSWTAVRCPEVILVIQRLANSHLLSRLTLGTALLEFFLHHGKAVLHKTDDSLSQFFLGPGSRAWLSLSNALHVVHFTLRNLAALCHVGATEKYFPALLKIFAWSPQQFKSQFLSIVPAFISAKSVVEVFHSLVDLPSLTAALLHEREMMGVPEGARAKRQSSVHIGSEVHKSMLKFVLRDISGIGDTFDG